MHAPGLGWQLADKRLLQRLAEVIYGLGEDQAKKIRLLRKVQATPAAIYGRDRSPHRIVGTIWFVTTLKGSIVPIARRT